MANRLAVDIGGTFTDVALEYGDGRRATAKVLTTPRAPEQGVLNGIRTALAQAGLSPGDLDLVIHGTTLATNAIIERRGAKTALVTTEGFRDVIDIATESRFAQYDLMLIKPRHLVPRSLRLTVAQRTDAEGRERVPLDEAGVRALVPVLEREGVEAVAVGYLHSYRNPAHEERTREILARALPDVSISLSAEVCPEVREYERFSTTVANAYVQPLMARYLKRLEKDLAAMGVACPVFLITSGGGLTAIETAIRFPIRLVESGPAGGAILAAWVAAECGERRVVSYDMGGTTAKVCLIHDMAPRTARTFEVDRAARFTKGSGLPLRIPVIEMIEIGAGGGSIAHVDRLGRIAVGPESAQSEPGPACYGRGGTNPTVTDADLTLGRIDPAHFAGGKMALDADAAARAVEQVVGGPLGLDAAGGAHGIAEVVDENMANAARVHAAETGEALTDHTMIAFGGAAPLHAARLAEKLGIERVIVPTGAGVGSAIGFLRAPVAYEVVRSRYMPLDAFDADAVNAVFEAMRAEAEDVVRRAAPGTDLIETRTVFMRYRGQGHEIVVPVPARRLGHDDRETLKAAFEAEYRAQFGRTIPTVEAEAMTWTLSLSAPSAKPAPVPGDTGAAAPAARPSGTRRVFDATTERFVEVAVHRRADLRPGSTVPGPALIVEDETSTYVTARFDARLNGHGYIVLQRKAGG
ncbi:MAG TPA: hydantoinase/oxoprolinase family protein [Azospirillaceae bacterium]|nr:hydantoinase/oxoprolinase family protein [Azospirillaceae bacterium]